MHLALASACALPIVNYAPAITTTNTNTTTMTTTRTKLCTFGQDGSARPLSATQAATLDADHRVATYWTEDAGLGRTLWITLAEGYHYEGRTQVVSPNWREATHNLRNVERGDAYANG